jgi:hypothetical protein
MPANEGDKQDQALPGFVSLLGTPYHSLAHDAKSNVTADAAELGDGHVGMLQYFCSLFRPNEQQNKMCEYVHVAGAVLVGRYDELIVSASQWF